MHNNTTIKVIGAKERENNKTKSKSTHKKPTNEMPIWRREHWTERKQAKINEKENRRAKQRKNGFLCIFRVCLKRETSVLITANGCAVSVHWMLERIQVRMHQLCWLRWWLSQTQNRLQNQSEMCFALSRWLKVEKYRTNCDAGSMWHTPLAFCETFNGDLHSSTQHKRFTDSNAYEPAPQQIQHTADSSNSLIPACVVILCAAAQRCVPPLSHT